MTSNGIEALTETTELDLSELARSRAGIYQILSTICAGMPGEQLVKLLHPWSTLERQLPRGVLPLKMKRGLKTIRVWLENNGSQPSEIITLGTEFTRLFRGLGRIQSPPPPYESVYLEDGLLHGLSTQRVAQKYSRFRLKLNNNEPPDYIAFELDFMRFLCEKEALAWQKGEGARDLLKEEGTFLSEHLARWVPDFCENIRQFDSTGFYKGVADVTEGWIQYDLELVTAIVEHQREDAKHQRGSN